MGVKAVESEADGTFVNGMHSVGAIVGSGVGIGVGSTVGIGVGSIVGGSVDSGS